MTKYKSKKIKVTLRNFLYQKDCLALLHRALNDSGSKIDFTGNAKRESNNAYNKIIESDNKHFRRFAYYLCS
jgi:hypothetical protein